MQRKKMLRRFIGAVKKPFEYALALPRVWAAPKTFVVVLCSMRSGSTLLNALLAEAPDVSHLPEIRWDNYLRRLNRFDRRAENLSERRIIVLKSPPWLTSTARDRRVLRLPIGPDLKILLLVRDAYAVVRSLEDLLGEDYGGQDRFVRYWCEAYESASAALQADPRYVRIVRYEELVAAPIAMTKDLFAFIGSCRQEGVDQYSAPKTFKWSWGRSDASEKIQSLRVQSKASLPAPDDELGRKLAANDAVVRLRRLLGYN